MAAIGTSGTLPALVSARLTAAGHTITSMALQSSDIMSIDLSVYDVIMVSSFATPVAIDPTSAVVAQKILNYIHGGGIAIFYGSQLDTAGTFNATAYTNFTSQTTTLAEDITPADWSVPNLTHPIFTSPNSLTQADFDVSGDVSDDSTPTWISGPAAVGATLGAFTVLVTKENNGFPLHIAGQLGDGWLFLISYTSANNAKTADYYENIVGYALSPTTTAGSGGADETGLYCAPSGSAPQTASHGEPGPAIALDYANGKAYRWDRLPFTCHLGASGGCAGSAEIPDGHYFGASGGYIVRFDQEKVYADGPWEGLDARLSVTAGDANTATVSETLTLIGDGLADMWAALVKNIGTQSESWQWRKIIYNTATQIAVNDLLTGEGSSWTTNPASGDTIFIGHIRPYVEFMEGQTERESYFKGIQLGYTKGASVVSSEIPMALKAFLATGQEKAVRSLTTPDRTDRFTLQDIDEEPEGRQPDPADGADAWRERLEWSQPPEGALVFNRARLKVQS